MERNHGRKAAALLLALVLALTVVVGGTIAWLTDASEDVVNTFTPSKVEVDIDEGTGDEYKMIPGWLINKNPKAKVMAGSEDSWLFITVSSPNATITDNGDGTFSLSTRAGAFLDYAIDSQWTELEDGVYYIKVDGTSATVDTYYNILGEGKRTYEGVEYAWEDDELLVRPTVTEEMMESLTENTYPKLSFAAYAVQLDKSNEAEFTAEQAWALVNP